MDLFDGGDSNDEPAYEQTTVEYTSTFSLAVGGVAATRDELVFFDENGVQRDLSGNNVACKATAAILNFEPRPDFDTINKGSGVQIIPFEPGIVDVTCTIDNEPIGDIYKVVIPPQSFIQILVAEAKTQITDEATPNENGSVALNSRSKTAEAIGMVIKNRIDLIENEGDPSLFGADTALFYSDPVASYYDAVIDAPYQFLPTDENDPSYAIYSNASNRYSLSEDSLTAYDQAVLTAAAIFNAETLDPTGGAFAFRSPNEDQWPFIEEALLSGTTDLPYESGVSDVNFPAFAPVQIVILDDIWSYEDGRPSFIFIRERPNGEHAVVEIH